MTEQRVRGTLRAAAALLSASALLSGCGVIPGVTGGSPGPVVVMTWAPVDTDGTNMPGMLAMAQVYEKYANDRGGFGGRKLKVLTCNEHDTIIGVRNCAQQAEDAGAVAVVGSYSEQGADFTAALETYDIPYIGGYGITEDEFESVESYPVNGGLPALLAGNGRQLADLCKKVTLVRPDTTTGDQFPFFLNAGLRAGGNAAAKDLRTADTSTEYTSVAEHAAGANKTSDCVSAVLGDHTSTFFDSLRHVGDEPLKVRVSSVLGSVTQSLVDSTGGAHSPLENAYVTSWYPPSSDPEWKEMKTAVTKYAFNDDRINVDDPGPQTTWIAYTVLDEVISAMKSKSSVSRFALQQTMDRTTNLSTGGLTPALGWTDADMRGIVGYSRLVDTKVTYQQVRNGRLVAARPGFIDLTATLSQSG